MRKITKSRRRLLKPADIRLILAALVCLALFTASTDEDEWCGECFGHESGEVIIQHSELNNSAIIRIFGPRRGTYQVLENQPLRLTLRSGYYNYIFAFVTPSSLLFGPNGRGAGIFEVWPGTAQTVVLTLRGDAEDGSADKGTGAER